MALDVGDARIGVAISDPLNIIATPLLIISRRDVNADIKVITDLVKKNGVERIIVGLPFSMDGSLGSQAEKVRFFVDALTSQTDIPIEYRDERLSTVVAKRTLQQTHKISRDTRYDAAAAALILQGYLEESLPPHQYQEEDTDSL